MVILHKSSHSHQSTHFWESLRFEHVKAYCVLQQWNSCFFLRQLCNSHLWELDFCKTTLIVRASKAKCGTFTVLSTLVFKTCKLQFLLEMVILHKSTHSQTHFPKPNVELSLFQAHLCLKHASCSLLLQMVILHKSSHSHQSTHF